MADSHRPFLSKKIQRSAATPGPIGAASPKDLLLKALNDLNIARKTMLIYPGDHENVQRVVLQAHLSLQGILSQDSQFTLAASAETLIFKEQRLDPRASSHKEMAQVLRQLAIAAFSFDKGLSREELARFIAVLTRDPQEVFKVGGIQTWIQPPDFTHTKVFALDYSQLEVTDESEIVLAEQTRKAPVWDRFVESVITQGGGQDKDGGSTMDPVLLAGLMNQSKVDVSKAVKGYVQLLQAHAQGTSISEPGDKTAEDISLNYFNELLQELNPQLREQFLLATYDHCLSGEATPQVSRILEGLGTDLVIQMLRYAKADSKQISPSLVALIRKIGHLPQTNYPISKGAERSPDLSANKFQDLLRREDYDTYVDPAYDILLKDLAEKHSALAPIEALSDELSQGLDRVGIDCHIGNALTRLMAISGDHQGYRDWARQLTLTLEDLADDRAFDCLSEILTFILEENRLQEDPEKKKIAGLVLNRFSDPQFIACMIKQLDHPSEVSLVSGANLLASIGDVALIEILDTMGPKDPPALIQTRLDLLAPFGRQAAAEALQRLNDPRPGYLCLMVRVIRRFGDDNHIEGMRSLMNHEHRDVRQETLAALLKHRNGWGLARLRELINDSWTRETDEALELAARYKVREVVPEIVANLRRRAMLSGEQEHGRTLMKTLNRIGDPDALSALTKLAHKRWTFAPKRLRNLQRGLFDALSGYPFTSVARLIQMGLKHKDEYIRIRCQELLKTFRGKPGANNDSPDPARLV
jgi:hypothetical protein